MFDAIKRGCQYYCDNIPNNTIHTVCKSALYSFTITFIMANGSYKQRVDLVTKEALPLELTRPYLAAAVAAIASTIHAFMTPFFHLACGDKEIKLHREIAKGMVVSALTYHLTASMAVFKAHWIAVSAFDMVPFNVIGSIINSYKDFIKWIDPQIDFAWLDKIQNVLGLDPQAGDNSAYTTPHFLSY